MKKIGYLLALLSINVWADADKMSVDILNQIIHGPVNTDPDISDGLADRTVIFSLQSAALYLACVKEKKSDELKVKECVNKRIAGLPSGLGEFAESSFNVGVNSAYQQALLHREVPVKQYGTVVNNLMSYSTNIAKQSGDNVQYK
ncbi:MAG: hypothetical protein EKK64_01065 [Neisseriaceae bacterium]|jgi:hypothetical protein|nr:MAG: hypothetical protein EKK64_01065 [Neisseriaceae bacterium]